MRRLPPGQITTERFPVVGERAPTEGLDASNWALEIGGLATPRHLDYEALLAMGDREITFDIHCVTGWTRYDSTFTGLPLADAVSPHPGARFVSFGSYSPRSHHTSLPLGYALEHSWVVHSFDRQPLTSEHGGPVRVVTPGKYFYKSIKWLRSVELLAEDRLGWWETNSHYHNNADPVSGDQRFTTGSLRPEQLRRFLEAPSYDKYRGRVFIGLDLTGWKPKSRDLRQLHLKNCDLSGVVLSGTDLRHSNLSLSRLVGADLSGADLSGSDLEGADFSGADLTDADLSDSLLSAARFDGSKLAGSNFANTTGLVESQARYVSEQGVSLHPR